MEEIDPIYKDLQLLSQLKPGKTLSTSKMAIIDHSSWSSAFFRRYYGEDRHKTLEKINEILTKALKQAQNMLIAQDPQLDHFVELFQKALTGVETLRETYDNDAELVKSVDEMLVAISNDQEYPLKKNQSIANSSPIPVVLENRNQSDAERLVGESRLDDNNRDGQSDSDQVVDRVDHLKKNCDTPLVGQPPSELPYPHPSREAPEPSPSSLNSVAGYDRANDHKAGLKVPKIFSLETCHPEYTDYTDFHSSRSSDEDLFTPNPLDLNLQFFKKKSRRDV